MIKYKSGDNRHVDGISNQAEDCVPHADKQCLSDKHNYSQHFWLIEQTNYDGGFIGWVGDVYAFIDRFGEVPPQASP